MIFIWAIVSVLFWLIQWGVRSLFVLPSVDTSDMFVVWLLLMAIVYWLAGITIVKEWERVPVMRLGRYSGTVQPGFKWVEPLLHETMDAVSLKTFTLLVDVEGQTHDNVPVSFKLLDTLQVKNVQHWICNTEDPQDFIQKRSLAVATEFLGSVTLNELLHDTLKLSDRLTVEIAQRVVNSGAEFISCEIQDVSIEDDDIKESMSLAAVASREAEAELTRARMQVQVSEQLNAAAAKMTPGAWKLKGYGALSELTRDGDNNTVLIPTSIVDMLGELGK